MRTTHHLLLAIVTCCALGAFLLAAEDNGKTPSEAAAAIEERVKLSPHRRATDLFGKPFKNNAGEEIGVVRDFVVDSNYGHLIYAVVEFTGNDRLKDKYVLLPFPLLKEDTARQNLVVGMSPEQIGKLEGFDAKSWPDMSDEKTMRELYGRFEAKPYWEKPGATIGKQVNNGKDGATKPVPAKDGSPATTVDASKARNWPRIDSKHAWTNRVSQMIGRPVTNGEDQALGKMTDVIIDLDGRVTYGIIAQGADESPDRKFTAVPWSAYRAEGDGGRFTLDSSREMLDALSFKDKEWPNTHDIHWARKMHEHFDREPYWTVMGYADDNEFDYAWRSGSSYDRMFADKPSGEFEGRVVEYGEYVPAKGAAKGRLVTIQSADGSLHTIHLGPEDFMKRQDVDYHFQKGTPIKVIGVQSTFEGKDVIRASQFSGKTGKALTLRDAKGRATWDKSAGQVREDIKDGEKLKSDLKKEKAKEKVQDKND